MIAPDTAADRHEQLLGGLSGVECGTCGAGVLVKKHSLWHTSVQWSTRAVRECAELAAAGEPTALVAGCGSLTRSIDRAVLEGRLPITDAR